jgi:hypothetical protein
VRLKIRGEIKLDKKIIEIINYWIKSSEDKELITNYIKSLKAKK